MSIVLRLVEPLPHAKMTVESAVEVEIIDIDVGGGEGPSLSVLRQRMRMKRPFPLAELLLRRAFPPAWRRGSSQRCAVRSGRVKARA